MIKTFSLVLALAATAAAGTPRIVPMTFTITATAYVQGVSATNGAIVTTAAPVQYSITTKSTLQNLALAEYNAGNYPASSFPAGAKLVWLDYADDFPSSYFIVTDSAGNPLCAVSNVLCFVGDIDNAVTAGKHTLSDPSLVTNRKETCLGSLIYDDTSYGGGESFVLGGLVQSTANDVVGLNRLTYKETITLKITGCIGNGVFYGHPLYMTGSCSASQLSSSILPNVISTFYTSSVATNEYVYGLGIGTVPKAGNSQQAALQALINNSVAVGNGTVIVDGCYTVAGLSIPSNARLIAKADGYGFIQMSNACGSTLGNANWVTNGIGNTNILISGLTVNVAMPYQHGNANGFPNPTYNHAWETSTIPGQAVGWGRTKPDFQGAINGFQFCGVNGLTLTNCSVWDFDNKHGAGNYGFLCFNATNVTVASCYFDCGVYPPVYATQGGDALHFNGPLHSVLITNCILRSSDDAIALNADDGVGTNHPCAQGGDNQYSPYYTGGEISDVIITNIFFNGAQAGIRLLSGRDQIRNIVIDGLSGTVNQNLLGLNYWSSAQTWPWGTPTFTNILVQNSTAHVSSIVPNAFMSTHDFISLGQTTGDGTNYTAATHIHNLTLNNVNPGTNIDSASLGVYGWVYGLTITNCSFTEYSPTGTNAWDYSVGVSFASVLRGDNFLLVSNRWSAFPGPTNAVTGIYCNPFGTAYGQTVIANFTAIGNVGTNIDGFFYNNPFVNCTNSGNIFPAL